MNGKSNSGYALDDWRMGLRPAMQMQIGYLLALLALRQEAEENQKEDKVG